MNIDYLIIFLVVLNCCISLYTDLKHGIVRNRLLLAIGIPTVMLNIISICLDGDTVVNTYITQILIGLSIAVLLYALKIWAGGDCKLYIVIILSTPFFIVNTFFFGISMLIYIPIIAFMLGYIYIIVDSFIQKMKKKTKEENLIKKSLSDFVLYLKYFVTIIFTNYVVFAIFTRLNIVIDTYFLILAINILLVISIIKSSILKYNGLVIFIVVIDIWLGLLHISTVLNQQILLTWIIVFFSNMIKNFVSNYNYKEVLIKDIEMGMILSTESSILFTNDKLSKFNRISDESLKSRLTEEDVENIKNLMSKRNYLKKVTIVKKVPFVLSIMLATCIALLGGIML